METDPGSRILLSAPMPLRLHASVPDSQVSSPQRAAEDEADSNRVPFQTVDDFSLILDGGIPYLRLNSRPK